MKKSWKNPTLILLSPNNINSANLQTMAIYENVSYTIDNTCTFNGADCTTADGANYLFSGFASGISANATMYGTATIAPIGTFGLGTIATCNSVLQCS